MLKAFYKARRKKGFTLVELVVVIAIIGVLLLLTIPSLLYDRRPEEGRAMAKDLLYNTQEIMTSVKAAAPDAASYKDMVWYDTVKKRFIVYVSIGSNGGVTETGLIGVSGSSFSLKSFTSLSGAVAASTDPLSQESQFRRFCDITHNGLVTTLTETHQNMEGTLAAVADEDFNIIAAYWFQDGINTAAATSADRVFTSDNVLHSGYLCVTYPASYSNSGQTVFNLL